MKLDFLKNNQEKLLLVLGFILVLCAGFFSGYFYSQSQIEKRKIIVEKPDQSCKNLFNLADSVNNNPISNLNVSPSPQTGVEQNAPKEMNLQKKTGMFVASKNSTIYHKPDCKYVKRIKEENKVWFKSAEEAEKAGYKPDKNCFSD